MQRLSVSGRGRFLLAVLILSAVLSAFAEPVTGPSSLEDKNLPLSELEIDIAAILSHPMKSQSGLIVRTRTGAQVYLRAGDTIADGITLESVQREAVVVNNDGRLEQLRIPRAFLAYKQNHETPSRDTAPEADTGNSMGEPVPASLPVGQLRELLEKQKALIFESGRR